MEGKKFESTARAPPQSLTAPPPGNVVFRILCDVSQVGDMIGKYGRVIKQLQESTESEIRVDNTPFDSLYCVITITAHHVGSTSRVKLGFTVNKEVQEQEVEVSRAQYTLIRVFEAINIGLRTSTSVSCRLLMEGSYVDTVIGRGGELLERIWRETGCKVVIQTHDLPICANPGDVMVKIEGNVSAAVKKALVSISSRMQACQATLSHCSSDHRLIASASKLRNYATKSKVPFKRGKRITLVFKILCSTKVSGRVIGKGGSIIRNLCIDTGAFIIMGDPLSHCDERLITITALEDPEDKNSPAQRAIVLVLNRIYAIGKFLDSTGLRSSITARLVVPSNQINCLVGKGGCIVSEIKKRTGAFIEVLKVEQNPTCVTENNNQIVQISGGFSNVKEAINQVTSRLRENVILHSFKHVDADPCIIPEDPFPNNVSRPTARYAPNLGCWSTMYLNDTSHHSSQAPYGLWASPTPAAPRGVYDGSGELSSTKDDLGFHSGLISSNVTNRTVQFRVSEHAVNSVFGNGQDGINLLQKLREVSGARITIVKGYLGTSDRIISISGTLDQIQAAQVRLQALFFK